MDIQQADPTPVETFGSPNAYGRYVVEVGDTLKGYLSLKELEIATAYDKEGDAAGEQLTDKLDWFDFAVAKRVQYMVNMHGELLKLAAAVSQGIHTEKVRKRAEELVGEWEERLAELDKAYGHPESGANGT